MREVIVRSPHKKNSQKIVEGNFSGSRTWNSQFCKFVALVEPGWFLQLRRLAAASVQMHRQSQHKGANPTVFSVLHLTFNPAGKVGQHAPTTRPHPARPAVSVTQRKANGGRPRLQCR